MVALVGSPPPVPTSGPSSYAHLVTGDDSEFTATTGNWVGTSVTMTRDTSYRWASQAGSLKFVTNAAGDRVDLAIPGTFKLGAEYAAFIAVSLEEGGAANASLRTQFGLVGTDVRDYNDGGFTPTSRFYGWAGSSTKWSVLGLRWKPTANRTGVSIRVERPNADGSNTQTWHIGWVKVFRLPVVDGPALCLEPGSPTIAKTYIAPSRLGNTTSFAGGYGGGHWYGGSGVAEVSHSAGRAGWSPGEVDGYLWAEHTASDLSAQGLNFEVGTDYVGMYMSEKDSDTVQMYADSAGGYMMQLRHRGSGKGWAASEDGTINRRIEAYFEWKVTVAGTLTTGTDKGGVAQVIHAPFKCRIDEVRCHVGTAPTGQSILVDVNDDGVTVFTSQGNRPEIAISGTDDTSGAADGGTAIAKDSVITVDIDQVGSGTAGADLTVLIRGTAIW